MEIQILPLIIVVAYLVGMLVVGAVVSKVQIKNAKDYMVAGRRMGLFMVAFSLSANNIGGGTWMFLMPVVAGCLVSTVSFYVVNWIEWARGVEPAPSAYLSDEEVTKKIAEESAGRCRQRKSSR